MPNFLLIFGGDKGLSVSNAGYVEHYGVLYDEVIIIKEGRR